MDPEINAIEFSVVKRVEVDHAVASTEVKADDDANGDAGDAGEGGTRHTLSPAQSVPSGLHCPYGISSAEEANAKGRDTSISGNVLVLEDFDYGRLGNRFVALSRSVSLGFCCKSKLVSTAAKASIRKLYSGINVCYRRQ